MVNRKTTTFHLPGITEVRGVAAILVVLAHIDQNAAHLKIPEIGLAPTGIAEHAVTVFFTLSGFLITYLLLLEKESNNTISTLKFYVRRMLRIWPAYYTAIILSILFIAFSPLSFPETEDFTLALIGYVFLMPNVTYTFGLMLVGTEPLWSIGVEEQYYLLWPLTIKHTKKIKMLTVGLVLIYLILKVIFYVFDPAGGHYALIKLSRFDCMAVGAYFAYSLFVRRPEFARAIFHPFVQIIAVLFLVLPLVYPFELFANLEIEIYAFCSAIWVANSALNQKSLITLTSSIFRFLGKVSYGIYVYHMMVIACFIELGFNNHSIITYMSIVSSVTLLAYISYYTLEKYFLMKKNRFSTVKSAW